jgi:type I restriction enzyme S subunit
MPFDVPDGWVWVKLGDIAFLKAGSFVRAEDIRKKVDDNLFPCYGGNGLRGYVETYTHEGFYSLIGRQGALCGNVNIAKGKFHATEHAVVTTLFCDTSPLWVFFTLKALNLNQYSNGAAQPGLSVERINKILFPLPPLAEQRRIVSVIESAFALIDEIEADRASLEQIIKQAKAKTLDLAIRGKLVAQNPDDEPASALLEKIRKEQKPKRATADISHYPFDVPDSWEWVKLGEIATHNTGKTLDKAKNIGTLREYITTSNLYWGYFELNELKQMPFLESEIERFIAIKGDLLICEGGDAGRSAVWENDYPICFQNHVHRVRFSDANTYYVYYYMTYLALSKQLDFYKKGVAIQSLSGQALSSIIIPLPPLSEQHRIVTQIETIFAQLDEITKAIEA